MNLRAKVFFCLALLSCFIFTGCVHSREFRGKTRNLRGDGSFSPGDKPLKLKFSGSGETINGGKYLALTLPQEKCQVVIFYPKLRPFPNYHYFRADIETNYARVRQIEEVWRGTNDVGTNFDLPPGNTAVWLVRGKPLRSSTLKLDGFCPTNVEHLFGRIDALTYHRGRDFYINAKLSNDHGTKISGTFESYKSLWEPIGLPLAAVAMMFGLVNE